MANHLYGYSPTAPTYGGASASPPSAPPRSAASLYLRSTAADMYLSHRSDALRYPSSAATADVDIGPPGVVTRVSGGVGAASSTPAQLLSQASWPSSYAAAAAASANVGSAATVVDPFVAAALKRSSEAFYHPTILGAHSTIGQSEAWYSTNSLSKRPRYESASNLSIYPQRPGEKDCAHYMLTRTCKFGDSCKFDHPIWVPEGGIPDWKEVPINVTSETLPERPEEPDCPYFLKTQKCKYGSRCKFNHPKDNLNSVGSENADVSALPERPSEPTCSFYMKTGKCKFGATCKFHHPKDIQIQFSGQQNGAGELTQSTAMTEAAIGDAQINPLISYTPPLMHNSKGLPIRLGEVDCPFYMKTGSCKYGATCRYNHPDRTAINPPVAALGQSVLASSPANLNFGVVNPAASIYQAVEPRLSNPMVGVGHTIYPQRPGQIECDYYMKTGECKFSERCKFHHPIDRSAPTKLGSQQTVKLTPAGLPRREGSVICPYYLKTGTCKFGATCKFDHPPPGEVMEMAKSQGISATAEGDEKGADTTQE